MSIDSLGGGGGGIIDPPSGGSKIRSKTAPTIGILQGRSVSSVDSPHLYNGQQRATFDSVSLDQRNLTLVSDGAIDNDELNDQIGHADQRDVHEDFGLPDRGSLTPNEVRGFLKTHLAGAKQVLARHRGQIPSHVYTRLAKLESEIETTPPFPMKNGKLDHGALKNELKAFTKSIRNILRDAGVQDVAHAQEHGRQEHLVSAKEWRTGYQSDVGDGGLKNVFSPIEQFGAGNDVHAATCHAFTTSDPTNAWKTEVRGDDGKSLVKFYRNGTFAPQPSKAGLDWNSETSDNVAKQRARKMATSMVTDYIRDNKGKVGNKLTYTVSNVDLMRHGLIVSEDKLSARHTRAMQALHGQTMKVQVDGEEYEVELKVRQWRQDFKDGPYFSNSYAAEKLNRQASQSIKKEISELRASGSVPEQELQEMESMSKLIDRQLTLHQRGSFRRAFNSFMRHMGKRLFGIKTPNPIMTTAELSAVILNLESKLAAHRPGGVSEGCKSGKDRGSLADVTTKALALKMEKNRRQGRKAMAGIRPGWMLKEVKSDPQFRRQVADLFKANFRMQELNAGLRGYITRDIFSWTGHNNYMDKVARECIDDVKAGSPHIKT